MRAPSRPLVLQALGLLGALAALTALFRLTPLDLAAARLFHAPCCSWPMSELPFWSFAYRYGVFLGVVLAAASLVLLTLTTWYPARLATWRRPALFMVLVVALGPGLFVNVVLKDNFGRPRPRDVVELGGRYAFLPVGVPGSDRQAKSFPCGHCSMGFYLATPWLVLRRRHQRAATAFLAAGLAAGGLLGAARMMAGGHFLSDVLWSGAIVWLVALALHHALDLDRVEVGSAPGTARDPRRARWATLLGGGALALLTAAALVATPYVSSKAFARPAAEVAASPAAVWEIDLDRADVAVEAGPGLRASYDVRAFGFPTSKVLFAFREGPDRAVLRIDRMGWFTERRTDVRLVLPADGPKPVRLRVGSGRVTLDLRGFSPAARLEVLVADGEVRLAGEEALSRLPGVSVRVERGRVVPEP